MLARMNSAGTLEHNVGNTPLILLKNLSVMTGCEIYGKAEFLNPGGSIKDRTALGMLREARKDGRLPVGGNVFEGTAGNTGIGLAMFASSFNYTCHVVMPDNQAQEKYDTLKALGAKVIAVPPCPFANPAHFYHTAKRLSEETPNSFWCNQFENLANFRVHYESTGPEIWSQTDGKVDIFCAASGTGGTLAGVSNFLKEKNPEVKSILVDPYGSGLFQYFKNGEMKSTGSSVTEGIGIMRVTANYAKAKVDEAMQVDDQKMISMLYYLAQKEGLLVGTSAALNVYAAYEIARRNKGRGLKIVTVLCDSALRYQSKLFNKAWLESKGLNPSVSSITA
ncbi:MAG: cysteine synthase A [Bdellovibrionota bacterium]